MLDWILVVKKKKSNQPFRHLGNNGKFENGLVIVDVRQLTTFFQCNIGMMNMKESNFKIWRNIGPFRKCCWEN